MAQRLGVSTSKADLIFVKACALENGGFNTRALQLDHFAQALLLLAQAAPADQAAPPTDTSKGGAFFAAGLDPETDKREVLEAAAAVLAH